MVEPTIVRPPTDERAADAAEAQVGYLVAMVDRGRPPAAVVGCNDMERAVQVARDLAERRPGIEFAVFKSSRTFQAVTDDAHGQRPTT